MLGERVDPEPRAGEGAERTLRADEELRQVRAREQGRSGVATTSPRPVTARDREHHVLDLPVLVRELPRAPRREPAAQRGHVDRRGEVAQRVALLVEARARGSRR